MTQIRLKRLIIFLIFVTYDINSYVANIMFCQKQRFNAEMKKLCNKLLQLLVASLIKMSSHGLHYIGTKKCNV